MIAVRPPDPGRPDAHLREAALAALLVLPAGTLVCGATSARLWRVMEETARATDVHVLLPPGVRHSGSLAGVRIHDGAPANIVVVDDVPCTDLPRTLLDVCGATSLAEAVVMLDEAERGHPGALAACRRRAEVLPRRNAARVRAALDLATGRTDSVLESLAWVLWHVSGLPAPLLQAVVRSRRRFLARVDFLWPDAMLIVEVDGAAKYAEPGEWQREKARQNRLVAEGYVVLRFTWADIVHRPGAVVGQVSEALKINSR